MPKENVEKTDPDLDSGWGHEDKNLRVGKAVPACGYMSSNVNMANSILPIQFILVPGSFLTKQTESSCAFPLEP